MTDAIYVRRFRIPNAATRSIINGDSFGDNMLGALPDIIGNTVGNALAGGLARPSNAKTAARDQATAIALSVDPNLSISQEDTAAINELADAQVALGKALANDKKVADKKGDPSFRSEKSRLAQREYDRRLNAMLDTRARSDAGWAAVDDYRTKMREAILGGSNSGLAVSGGEDQVIVKGDPDNIKYMASRQIDGAGIRIGKEKENLTNRFGQFMQENPGAAIALQVADTGMKIAAPGKAALGWLFEKASEPIKGLISDGYSNAGWSQENSNHGGEGIYTASSLLLNGSGGIHAKVGGAKSVPGALAGAERAIIDPRKLTEYALNPAHPVGGNKARVFESAFGFNVKNAHKLLAQIRQGVRENPAVAGNVDKYGSRFAVDIPVIGPKVSGTVRTGWILKPGSDIPEITTLFAK